MYLFFYNSFQTLEEEQEHFEEYVSKFGEARFSDLAKPNFQARNYTISSDLEEWKYVERLLPLSLIPEVPKKDHYPSGFKLPKYSAEEAIEKYQYFVGRTAMHMLPVYCEVKILEVDKKKGNAKIMRLTKREIWKNCQKEDNWSLIVGPSLGSMGATTTIHF